MMRAKAEEKKWIKIERQGKREEIKIERERAKTDGKPA